MIKHVEVSGDVAVEIHRHEAGELQKARIDLPAEAGIGEWHGVQAVAAEPFDAALLGELVDLGRAASGVDRAAHQGHAGRGVGVAARLHQRGRGKQRHRRLTDADRVDAGAENSQHLAQIVDVVVEVEGADRQRNHPRVRPVGDVDIEIRQKRFDGAAEQSRVVAGHRRDDQELRLIGPIREVGPDEAKQIAERLGPDDVLEDRMDDAVDLDFVAVRRSACRSGASSVRTIRRRPRCSCPARCWRADSTDCERRNGSRRTPRAPAPERHGPSRRADRGSLET